MSGLSKHLQSPDILGKAASLGADGLRESLLAKGSEWYLNHPEESALIRHNLQAFDLCSDDKTVRSVEHHIVLHYYEKLLPLCGDPKWYRSFISDNVDMTDASAQISDAAQKGGILVAAAHFGAVELVPPSLSITGVPVNPVLRFTTEKFSAMAHERASTMESSGLFGHINFIEIGREGTMAALEMAAAIRRKEILLSVFDEETSYSIPAKLFGRTVNGGAGLQNLIKFARAPLSVFCAFMVRLPEGRYRFDLVPVQQSDDTVASMYRALEAKLADNLEQWYFLHEEIPFV